MVIETIQSGRIAPDIEDGSLKARLFALMQEKANKQGWLKGVTPAQLAKDLGSTEHHIVHLIMDSLAGAGLVTYRKSRSNSIYNLRLSPPAMGKQYAVGTMKNKTFREKLAARTEAVVIEATEIIEQEYTPTFPIIENLVSRRTNLLSAAKQIEDDAPEIALALMEKADIPLSPLEQECVKLFSLYING